MRIGGRLVAVVQARMTSSRLPGKVLLPLAGVPMIVRIIERLRRVDELDAICVAIPDGSEHKPLADVVTALQDVVLVRGDENDLLARTLKASRETHADSVVRVTSDCPFIDPSVIRSVIQAGVRSGCAYARTSMDRGYPLGLDTEVIASEALEVAAESSPDAYEREHATPYVWRRPENFSAVYLDHAPDRRHWRLVVDSKEDYELARRIYEELYPRNPGFGFTEIVDLLTRTPELLALNRAAKQTPYRPLPRENPGVRTGLQLARWRGDFGDAYIERNLPSVERIRQRSSAFSEIFRHLASPEPRTILEAGANIGLNLRALSTITSADLWALEPNQKAREILVSDGVLPEERILDGTLNALPFSEDSIDLVFSSCVLIHLSDTGLTRGLAELVRVSRRYLLIMEYFSPETQMIRYRGLDNMLFKRDYGGILMDLYPQLGLLADGFFWKRTTGLDNVNWWLFRKPGT